MVATNADFTALMARYYPSVIPWFVCRDAAGYWCVQRHGAWSCVVRLTGATSLPDDRLEEHARDVADALNRVYSARPR
jgi:hypothetical protein